jgi:hypothetical protein
MGEQFGLMAKFTAFEYKKDSGQERKSESDKQADETDLQLVIMQTKLFSFIEAATNTIVGLLVSFGYSVNYLPIVKHSSKHRPKHNNHTCIFYCKYFAKLFA